LNFKICVLLRNPRIPDSSSFLVADQAAFALASLRLHEPASMAGPRQCLPSEIKRHWHWRAKALASGTPWHPQF
jgi:hypothetical protein